jgi:hypothetical protein
LPNDDHANERGTRDHVADDDRDVSVDGVMQGLGGPDEDRGGRIRAGTAH